MLAPFVSAHTLARLDQPDHQKQIRCRTRESTMNHSQTIRATRRAENICSALRTTTVRCGGLATKVKPLQMWIGLPDPVRRNGNWHRLRFVELATVTCFAYDIEALHVNVHLRLQALVSDGYAPAPLPQAPHRYGVTWPLAEDQDVDWLQPYMPQIEWQCVLKPRGGLHTETVRIVDKVSAASQRSTIEVVRSTERSGCRVDCLLKIPLAEFC